MDTLNDNESFQVINRKRARHDSPKQVPNGPPKPKVKPLVLEGLSDEECSNPLTISKLLKEAKAEVAKTVKTKQGKILVFAKSEEAKSKLLKKTLRSGVSLRQTKDRVT